VLTRGIFLVVALSRVVAPRFVSDTLRISRGNKGTTFIFRRLAAEDDAA
jgi:hypothetical protein